MTPRALHLMHAAAIESESLGDESMPASEVFEAIDVDPNAVSDLEFRLKVSNRLLEVERMAEQTRQMMNRVLLRFQLDGRPIPEERAS
jgi:hypothetical protein